MLRIPHLGQIAALSIIGTVSLMPLLVLPAMIGVLVDNAGMSESSAGWSASLHFLASATAGLLIAVRVHRVNLRRVSCFALGLAVAADLVSAFTAGEAAAFFAARLAAGFMLGAAYVGSVSSFARLDGYARGFGLFVTLQFTVSGLGLYALPVYADTLGAGGLFGLFACLDALALLLARRLPADSGATAVHAAAGSELRILLSASALLAIIGFAVFEAANNAQFTYIERFGVALELSDRRVGFALMVSALVGIPGAFSIVIVGQRFGTLGPIVLGIVIALAGLTVLLRTEGYRGYLVGSCCIGFSWAFGLPFIQSLLAAIDRQGSAIAAGTSLSIFGTALGPGAAAVVVAGGDYHGVFKLSAGLFAVALLLFYCADRTRIARRR